MSGFDDLRDQAREIADAMADVAEAEIARLMPTLDELIALETHVRRDFRADALAEIRGAVRYRLHLHGGGDEEDPD